MRNLQEHPITNNEVIGFLEGAVEIEKIISESTIADGRMNYGNVDPLLAKTALAVVAAAAIVVQNDIGSQAAELLSKAFNSQNVH